MTNHYESDVPYLHVYGQEYQHADLNVYGTIDGLRRLKIAINKALVLNDGRTMAFSTDGEGFTISVRLLDESSMFRMRLPYTDESAKDYRKDVIDP